MIFNVVVIANVQDVLLWTKSTSHSSDVQFIRLFLRPDSEWRRELNVAGSGSRSYNK